MTAATIIESIASKLNGEKNASANPEAFGILLGLRVLKVPDREKFAILTISWSIVWILKLVKPLINMELPKVITSFGPVLK